jgi:hypothetical protein
MNPHGLWSLEDMLRVYADKYLRLGGSVQAIRANVVLADEPGKYDKKTRQRIRKYLRDISDLCDSVDLPVSKQLVLKLIKTLPKNLEAVDLLITAILAEFGSKLFFYVPSHRAKHYEQEDALSENAKQKFPSAAQEIRLAGNCLSAGMDTASVFHCMRAVEVGLGALAKDVNKAFDIQNWQNIINEIEAAVKEEGKKKNSAAKSARLKFLSQATAESAHFKDGWRNHVMHRRETYDEAQALIVMDHVRRFIEIISQELTE